jgi:ketosteroid isomerase-like protein
MMALSLERRIDRMEARAAIADLVTDYCTACDDHDFDLLGRCFTADIRLWSPGREMDVAGRDDAMAMYARILSIRGPAFHWTSNHIVRFDEADPNRATGLVLAHAETTPNGVASIAAIRYSDVYAREDGAWKFAARTLAFLYYLPLAEFIARFPQRERVGFDGGWRDADFPESLPTWGSTRGPAR